LDTLLEAMCEVTRRVSPEVARKYCLVIVGGDAESAAEFLDEADCLDDLRERHELPDLVMFLGSRDQEMLAYYYSAAEVCVIPSRYESFGMVALEAMACGTPVIASRVGGLMYTIEDGKTGFLVPDQDPEALADKIELLLSNRELGERMGREALAVTAQYDWSQIAGQIRGVYAQEVAQQRTVSKPTYD
jgi:D-inositol-3-phosphate glycosyltransferase